jgi:hypothetical protein
LPLPEAGAALLAHLLDALVEAVPGAVGASLALGTGEGGAAQPQVVAEVGAHGPHVVTARDRGEEQLALALVLDRPPVPSDAESAGAALPGLALAVGVLRAWAAETERAEQMVQMVQYRRVIEQAKGLVMAVTGSDAAAAFATLARASQHFNVRLRNLAVALVELVGGGPAEGPDDPAAVLVPGERDRSAAARMWAALGGGVAGGRGEG